MIRSSLQRSIRLPRARPLRGRTVRTMFSLVCTVAAGGLVAAAINSGADSFVRLEPSKNVVAAGDSFSIEVYAVAGEPVNAVDITLSFNDNDVRVQGIDTGESVITLWTEEPVAQNGTVHLSGGTDRKSTRLNSSHYS